MGEMMTPANAPGARHGDDGEETNREERGRRCSICFSEGGNETNGDLFRSKARFVVVVDRFHSRAQTERDGFGDGEEDCRVHFALNTDG